MITQEISPGVTQPYLVLTYDDHGHHSENNPYINGKTKPVTNNSDIVNIRVTRNSLRDLPLPDLIKSNLARGLQFLLYYK